MHHIDNQFLVIFQLQKKDTPLNGYAQAISKFKVVWPEVDIGIVKAESDKVSAQVVVASIQTASKPKRLAKLKEQGFGLLIIDEAHHAIAPSYATLIEELGFFNDRPEKLLVGVTATPKRGDGIGLGSVFQDIVFERSMVVQHCFCKLVETDRAESP